MPTLSPEKWTRICTDLDRYLSYARPNLYEASASALSLFPRANLSITPYSPTLHKPFFTVGQLMAASYFIWQRAYVDSAHHKDFVAFLWAHVLQEHFGVARAFLHRLPTQAASRFEQLLSLFSALAPQLVQPVRASDALLFVCHVGLPLVESSFTATARAFGDPLTPRVAQYPQLSPTESPLFDRGFVRYVTVQRARPAGA